MHIRCEESRKSVIDDGERLLETRSLCAGYGGVQAITNVDMYVNQGEMIALLGANGAGKTTTLLALAGVIRAASGEVALFGEPGKRQVYRRARSGVALMPEQKAVFMGLTVRENLLLGRGDAEAALEFFPELRPRLRVRAGLTSGGEQQMLALARILAAKPRIILADELSLGLAPLIVRRLLEALSSAAAQGAGVLIVEQHPQTALRWTDRAYVMRRGRVELTGSSPEMLQHMDKVRGLYL
jgi:ABC-type branched-subunit amino acid transport system ATPase component